ncbi:MAG: TatD family hydrolase [Xanthomonadales bacterium]|nr:TatD family hydrolase [Xanthomonadales bacterium]
MKHELDLVDIGCNLTHDSFDKDREQVIRHATEAGVSQMVVTGGTAAGSTAALELAKQYPNHLFATAGVHPHHAADYTIETDQLLRQLLLEPEVVAVGEAGLDYFRDFSPRLAQKKAFEQQIQIAIDTQLPLFLHQRDAHADFFAILKSFRDQLAGVVVHCFTDTREALHDYLDLDCHIGITGWICDERRGAHLKDLVEDIPANRLLIETDAPYLKPRNLRPKIKSHRNEPRVLPWVLGTVAACRGESPLVTAANTSRNARSFFNLP